MKPKTIVGIESFGEKVRKALRASGNEDRYREVVKWLILLLKEKEHGAAIKGSAALWAKWVSEVLPERPKLKGDWKKARDISQAFVSKLDAGSPSDLIYAIAIHYRLHGYQGRKNLQPVRILDKLVFGKNWADEFGPVFEFEDGPPIEVDEDPPDSWQPSLTLPRIRSAPIGDDIQSKYMVNLRITEVIGREKEEAQIAAFANDETGFRWMQIAGVAGQGKTRLAYDLALIRAEAGWNAGFLDSGFIDKFVAAVPGWHPDRPQLIIIDCVIGQEAQVGCLMTALAETRDHSHPVRLLLLERQRWDRGGVVRKSIEDNGNSQFSLDRSRAAWFLEIGQEFGSASKMLDFADPLVELSGLSIPELVAIVKAYATNDLSHSDKAIEERLERLDASGSPLFARFLAEALSEPDVRSRPSWTKEDLLDFILTRAWQRWPSSRDIAPQIGDNTPAMRLAVFATLVRGIAVADARAFLGNDYGRNVEKEALALLDAPIGSTARGPVQIFPPLDPGILGSWFVLCSVGRNVSQQSMLDWAWANSPKGTSEFIQYLVQDFALHPTTALLAAYIPSGDAPRRSYYQNVGSIVTSYVANGFSPPPEIIEALRAAADTQNIAAMDRLAYCHCFGRGLAQDQEKAVKLWSDAGAIGHPLSNANLGVCRQYALGCERDIELAVKHYRIAEKHDIGWAIANLALCHKYGDGVAANMPLALELLERAVRLRDGWGVVNLGRLYDEGYGVDQCFQTAISHYEHAISLGDARAITYLGECYEAGKGVQKCQPSAIRLYRDGVAAFDARAMAKLGECYLKGNSVPTGKWKAVGYFARGARIGDGLAFANLGKCFEAGLVVHRNIEMAECLYRRGIEYNDPKAKLALDSLKKEHDEA